MRIEIIDVTLANKESLRASRASDFASEVVKCNR